MHREKNDTLFTVIARNNSIGLAYIFECRYTKASPNSIHLFSNSGTFFK